MTWRTLLRILVVFAFVLLVYADAQRKDEDHLTELDLATANDIAVDQVALAPGTQPGSAKWTR